MNVKHLLIILIVLVGLIAGCSEVSKMSVGRSEGGIQIQHIPLSINEVPTELIQQLSFPYVRFYRTEITNNTDRPIKIIWFDGYFKFNGSWSAGNIRNKVLRNSDFLDWHTNDEINKDGWIKPGGKAICLVNWHWTETPEDIESKWAYIGVDAHGNDYFAEAIVPPIKPEKLR